MVDDSMEIASEHGHDIIEEDIDIDIDITTGQVDEDDILDDIDEANLDEIPPNAGTDDLMVDDDDASYHMEDADLLQEESDDHNMEQEQEPAGMSFGTDDHSRGPFDEMHTMESTNAGVNDNDRFWDPLGAVEEVYPIADTAVHEPQQATQTFDDTHVLDATNGHDSQHVVETEQQIHAPGETSIYNEEQAIDSTADTALNRDNAESAKPSPTASPRLSTDESSHPKSPQETNWNEAAQNDTIQNEPLVKALEETPANAPEDAQEPAGPTKLATEIDVNNQTSNEEEPVTSTDPSAVELAKAGTPPSEQSDEFSGLNHAQEILVRYNGRKYPLIRKSPLDHPNDFFFEDPSVIEKPMVEFCAEIRAVLVEENLPPKDRISLIIEELQLVIDEIHLSHYPEDLSLGHIMRLYERLVNNDGSGVITPLNLKLLIEPTPYDRFSMLSQGAAEGKGLLEFLTWDGESEDDPTEFGDLTSQYDPGLLFEEPDLESKPEETNVDAQQESHNDQHVQSPDEPRQHQNIENVDTGNSASAEVPASEHTEDVKEAVSVDRASFEEILLPADHTNDANDNDDGDLIDYSDGEDIEKPAVDMYTNSASDETREDPPHNEAKQELRQGSVSLQAEGGLDNSQPDAAKVTNDANEAAEYEDVSGDVGSDIDYEEENADEKLESEETAVDIGPEYSQSNTKDTEDGSHLTEVNDGDGEHNVQSEDGENGDEHGDYSTYETQEQTTESLDPEHIEFNLEDDFESANNQTVEQDEFDLGEGVDESTAVPIDELSGAINDTNAPNIPADQESAIDTKDFGLDDAEESDSATISNASLSELLTTEPINGNEQQEDEIDYDDDEDEEEFPAVVIAQEKPLTPKESPVSNSGKRPRAEANFEDGVSAKTNEAKRIRS